MCCGRRSAQAHVTPIFQEPTSSSIIRWFTEKCLKGPARDAGMFCRDLLDRDLSCQTLAR